MCTVTYLPLSDGGYILTTNRDESPKRAPVKFPHSHHVYGKEIIFPQDGEAKGGWIGTTDFGVSAVIMNGAHEPHVRRPPYRISRGQVLVDALECIRPKEFIKNYDFSGIEPFTLIMVYEDEDERTLLEFRWDGENPWHYHHPTKTPHIWAAKMLYDESAQQLRRQWFQEWLAKKPDFTQESIMQFHYEGGNGDPENDLRMNRQNMVATISITSVQMSSLISSVRYFDLRTQEKSELAFQQLPMTMYAYVYDQN